MEDDTDMDLQYYLNTQGPVQPTQLRYRGHVASQLQFGWQSNGQLYGLIGQRPNSDATRNLPQDVPVYSSYVTADYSSDGYQLLKRVSPWDIWAPNGGWYWSDVQRASRGAGSGDLCGTGVASERSRCEWTGVVFAAGQRAGDAGVRNQ